MTADFPAAVFVPNPEHPGFTVRGIRKGSAIVGREQDGRTLIYFEGNVYGAGNMVTLADRAMFAYWRMRDRYPTVACAVVDPAELVKVGTLHPQQGLIAIDGSDPGDKLADWVGCDPALVFTELGVRGVRV